MVIDMKDALNLIVMLICMLLCGIVLAETSVSSGYFRLSMGDTEVEQKYSKLQNVIVGGIGLAEECNCTVTIHRPDITVKWSQSDPVLTLKMVSWSIPTHRDNGNALPANEIDHYIVSYWKEGGSEQFITVSGVEQEQAVEDLPKGTWIFRVMTVDTDGLEGEWSELVRVVI